jgi:hypothetical protein
MPRYEHALILIVDAPTYEESMKIADDIATGLQVEGEEALLCNNYSYDLDNGRVVYLTPHNVALPDPEGAEYVANYYGEKGEFIVAEDIPALDDREAVAKVLDSDYIMDEDVAGWTLHCGFREVKPIDSDYDHNHG